MVSRTAVKRSRKGGIVAEILLPSIGITLLVLVAIDVFMTVFNPAEYGGPITLRQNRLIWAIARTASSRSEGRRRHRALALAAPLMAITTVLLWLMMLIVGFGLIYLPWMRTFLVDPGHLRNPLVEAFYFSASTATTLSIGDLVPDLDAFRVLVPLETLAGVGLLTAVLQYILAISDRAQAMATVALDIRMHFDTEHTPENVTKEIVRSEDTLGWGEWCEEISRSLLGLWEAHTRYPILLYFHPPDECESLSTQLGNLMRLQRSIQRTEEPGPLARHPGFRAMCRSLELYLTAVDRYFLPGPSEPKDGGDRVDEAYERLLQQTGYSGDRQGHLDIGEHLLEQDQRPGSKRSA
jgi:Ion channel